MWMVPHTRPFASHYIPSLQLAANLNKALHSSALQYDHLQTPISLNSTCPHALHAKNALHSWYNLICMIYGSYQSPKIQNSRPSISLHKGHFILGARQRAALKSQNLGQQDRLISSIRAKGFILGAGPNTHSSHVASQVARFWRQTIGPWIRVWDEFFLGPNSHLGPA